MKTRFLIILAAVAVLSACAKDEPQEYDFSNYTIDKVVCEAGSAILVADNISELDLHVKLYSQMGTYTDIYGQQQSRYVEIPRSRWRNHDVKFFLDDRQITPPYKTSNTTPSALRFRAEVDGIRSSQSPAKLAALFPRYSTGAFETNPPVYSPDPDPFFFEVTAVEPYVMPARKIPVVFHIIDTRHNANRSQILDAGVIYDVVKAWNAAFGRKSTNAPDGGNANIEFVPALRDPSGVKMAEPGINRIYLTDAQVTEFNDSPWLFLWNMDYINYNSRNIRFNESWYNFFRDLNGNNQIPNRAPSASRPMGSTINPYFRTDRYLNVYVIYNNSTPSDAGLNFNVLARESMPMVIPEGVYDAGALPLPSLLETRIRHLNPTDMTMWNTNPGNLRLPPVAFNSKVTTPRQVGLVIRKSDIVNDKAPYVTHMGAFLGLLPVGSRNFTSSHQMLAATGTAVWVDDFCSDTPLYNPWFTASAQGGMQTENEGSNRVKYTLEPPYYIYRSTNIMEINTAATSITPDQLRRMDWVLNNVPGRMMWKDLTAIDQ
jgi:hypothetical protein